MNRLIAILCVAVLITAYPAWSPRATNDNHSSAFISGAYLSSTGSALALADLERIHISAFNPHTHSTSTLIMQRHQGNWALPQHGHYPVNHPQMFDATIGNLFGLKKRHFETSDRQRFPDLGVLDPESRLHASTLEKGKRITCTDVNGNILLDIIWGRFNTEQEYTYVRNVGSDDVYTCAAHLSFNTDYRAWIQRRLIPDDLATLSAIDCHEFNGKPFQETVRYHYGQNFRWQRNGAALQRTSTAFKMFLDSHVYLSAEQVISTADISAKRLRAQGFQLASAPATDADPSTNNTDIPTIINGSMTYSLHFRSGTRYDITLGQPYQQHDAQGNSASYQLAHIRCTLDSNIDSNIVSSNEHSPDLYSQFYFVVPEITQDERTDN